MRVTDYHNEADRKADVMVLDAKIGAKLPGIAAGKAVDLSCAGGADANAAGEKEKQLLAEALAAALLSRPQGKKGQPMVALGRRFVLVPQGLFSVPEGGLVQGADSFSRQGAGMRGAAARHAG